MSYNPERELNKQKEMKSHIKWMTVFGTYAGAWIGAEFARYNDDFQTVVDKITGDFLSMQSVNLGPIHKIPGFLNVFPTEIRFILIAWFCVFLYAISIYCDYLNNKNTRTNEEVDSSSFNIDYDKLNRDYIMSPTYLKQGFIDGKIPATSSNHFKFMLFLITHPFSSLFIEKKNNKKKPNKRKSEFTAKASKENVLKAENVPENDSSLNIDSEDTENDSSDFDSIDSDCGKDKEGENI